MSANEGNGHEGLGAGPKGLTIIDAVISLCLIGVLFLVVVPRYQRLTDEARETALKAELTNIRTTVKLFRLLNGRHPESLRELTEKNILMPADKESFSGSILDDRYLLPNAVDAEGNITDAFGSRYVYDPGNGTVRSGTSGYENW